MVVRTRRSRTKSPARAKSPAKKVSKKSSAKKKKPAAKKRPSRSKSRSKKSKFSSASSSNTNRRDTRHNSPYHTRALDLTEKAIEIYAQLDHDHNRAIDHEEFANAIDQLGLEWTDKRVQHVFTEADEDNNDVISESEFLAIVEAHSGERTADGDELAKSVKAADRLLRSKKNESEDEAGPEEEKAIRGRLKKEMKKQRSHTPVTLEELDAEAEGGETGGPLSFLRDAAIIAAVGIFVAWPLITKFLETNAMAVAAVE